MSDTPPVAEALDRLLAFLRDRKIEYMLLGGLAVRVLAIPRPTYDLDLMVAVDDDGARGLAQAAEDAAFVGHDAHLRGFVDRLAGLGKIGFTIPLGDRFVPVDVFLLSSDYQKAAFARRTAHQTSLGTLWVISPEDLLLHKLLADRPRDRADVADLLLVIGPLDEPHLAAWSSRLGITDRLDRALREAGRK